MNERVENVYDQPMKDHNASNNDYSTLTEAWNSKHGELYKASMKRDRLMIFLIVMQLICLSVAVASIVMYFSGPIWNKGVVGIKEPMGDKGPLGDKGKPLSCLNGWVQFMSSCYYFQFNNKKTWGAAKDDCHTKGGFLVKIDNAVENWFLKTYLKTESPDSAWIGDTDSQRESSFVWESDNSPLTYTDWAPGEPNNEFNNEDCLQLRKRVDYKWNDYPCTYSRSYICEKQ
ncbi:unnamed protein product [Mytilus edulis]|uniref:C-type lectin domain-containing protein n=1 Tax=Mytilus edulis TaxID=6550 RepID=A0A8S3SVN7_MYTED|nr:unnamed protein product [Mytilus edulis]